MLRKLSVTLAIFATLWPLSSLALGLGSIRTQSALNENFQADIELLAVEIGDLDSIQASLASPVDFARARVERPFLLSKLRFKTLPDANGRPVIRVTSHDLIREPYLNFLVEVNWPKGRLVREYTVLLDPPSTSEQAPPPRLAPVTTTPPEERLASTGSEERPKPPERPTKTKAVVSRPAAAETAGQYGPVQRGLSLWAVAKRLAAPGARVEQVMAALHLANPTAFVGSNINRLRAGATLHVPRRPDIVEPSTVASSSPAPSSTSDQLRITVKPKPADGKAPPLPSGDMERVKTDLLLVRETGEATRQNTDELRTRIRDLEAQLGDIRQLLKLKTEQLSQFQQNSPSAGTVPLVVPPTPPAPSVKPSLVETTAPRLAPPVATPAAPPSEPTPFTGWLEDPIVLGGGGALLLLLLAGGWMWRRRTASQSEEDDSFTETFLSNRESGETLQINLDHDSETPKSTRLEARSAAGGDLSVMDDFSSIDADALREETGEVDPLAEADVYIAYGRFQRAETLVKQALEKDPQRDDLKLKLLEIYYTTRNGATFAQGAEMLEAVGMPRRDPANWARICSMGQELLPAHPLFMVTARHSVEERAVTEPEFDLDLPVLTARNPVTMPAIAPEATGNLRDGAVLEFSRLVVAKPPVAPPAQLDPISEIALDLDALQSLEDIDLGDLASQIAIDMPSAHHEEEPQPLRLDLEFPATAQPVARIEDEEDLPAISLEDLDLDEPLLQIETLSDSILLDDALQGMSLGQGEETETKLDLARAYLEMGDSLGAREILQEVLIEGSTQQQEIAQELLNKLE